MVLEGEVAVQVVVAQVQTQEEIPQQIPEEILLQVQVVIRQQILVCQIQVIFGGAMVQVGHGIQVEEMRI